MHGNYVPYSNNDGICCWPFYPRAVAKYSTTQCLTPVVPRAVQEDEVYDLQFGRAFAEQATNPGGAGILRDDFALEIADMDE